VSGTGSEGLQPRQRLADDAGEKPGSRGVRLARPHHHAGQPYAHAFAEAAPGVVGEQQLSDRLLRAVGGKRREMEVIGNGVGKRRAEHRNRRSEDELRPVAVADGAHRFQKRARSVEVDAIAFFEIELRFTGDDAGEMEDRLRPWRDCFGGFAGGGEIGADGLHLARWLRGRRRRDDVEQRELFDRLTVELARAVEPLAELAADHAGRPGDENVHV
jgi:hypothetical protein